MTDTPHPMQPVVMVGEVARFKSNAIVRFLLDAGPFDMNQLAGKNFSSEDEMQFAQLIGYSVSGYSSLNYVSDESVAMADREVERLLSPPPALQEETPKCAGPDQCPECAAEQIAEPFGTLEYGPVVKESLSSPSVTEDAMPGYVTETIAIAHRMTALGAKYGNDAPQEMQTILWLQSDRARLLEALAEAKHEAWLNRERVQDFRVMIDQLEQQLAQSRTETDKWKKQYNETASAWLNDRS